jgi:hypothetical protein
VAIGSERVSTVATDLPFTEWFRSKANINTLAIIPAADAPIIESCKMESKNSRTLPRVKESPRHETFGLCSSPRLEPARGLQAHCYCTHLESAPVQFGQTLYCGEQVET